MVTITSSRGLQDHLREENIDGYFSEVNRGNSDGARGCGGNVAVHTSFQIAKLFFSARRPPRKHQPSMSLKES